MQKTVFVKEECLSASEFLRVMREQRHSIRSVRYVHPELGSWGQRGHYRVEYYISQKRTREAPSFMEGVRRLEAMGSFFGGYRASRG